jgi:hypothetical protein
MILGIDQSLVSTGFCLIDKNNKIIKLGKIQTYSDVIQFCNKILIGDKPNPEFVLNTYLQSHISKTSGLVKYCPIKKKVITTKPKVKMFKYEKKKLKLTIEPRMKYIQDQIINLIGNNYWKKITILGCEMPSLGSIGQVPTLSQLLGFLEGFAYANGKDFIGIYPTSLKSFAKVKSKDKIDMFYALEKEEQEKVTDNCSTKNDDIVDAIWLAKYILSS